MVKVARVSRNLSISAANDERLSREAGDRVLNPGVLVDVALERWFAALDAERGMQGVLVPEDLVSPGSPGTDGS